MQKAFVGLISLTVLVAVAVMSLVIQNIHALPILKPTMISNVANNLSPWSLIVSSALSLFDDTTVKISNAEQSDSPKYTTVSSSSETRTVRTDFTYNSGFKFANDYTNEYHVIPDKYIPDFIYDGGLLPFSTQGRCGGMAFAALDYWNAGQRMPDWGATPPAREICSNGRDDNYDGKIDEAACRSPGNPSAVPTPANDTPLSKYILQRLYDSLDFSLLGILKGLVSVALTTSPVSSVSSLEEVPRYIYLFFGPMENKVPWFTWDCGPGCLPGTRPLTDREVIKATRLLDQKKPIVLGLVDNDAITHSHQVVAYGYHYDKAYNTYTFFIWDNNKPGMEVKASWTPGVKYSKLHYWYEYFDSKKGFTKAQFNGPPYDSPKNWKAFFVEDYEPRAPPTLFVDIDKDGIDDSKDNCKGVSNPDQKNTNGDEFGDACQQGDQDKDGVVDSVDNCRWVANPDQNPDACKDVIL